VTGTEQRACPSCGTGFTWTSAAPRQRFCSEHCRHKWWNQRRRQGTAALRRAGGNAPGTRPAAPVPHAHDPRGDTPRAREGTPRDGITAAVPACPHCRKPVAVVAWLVPPAAASIDTPRHAGNNA
jgi:endogenous inhibitor of DNA gyrase (YacG/DUF329 family)